jgi:hypothetical protein
VAMSVCGQPGVPVAEPAKRLNLVPAA